MRSRRAQGSTADASNSGTTTALAFAPPFTVNRAASIMDGVEMNRRMRADPELASIPVVLMTALPLELPQGSLLYNATLPKPFSPEALLSTLARILPSRFDQGGSCS